MNSKEIASSIEDNKEVKSHLPFEAEYDSVLEWFIKTRSKTLKEIAEDSTEWGNYLSPKNFHNGLARTGYRDDWCVNKIYDFAGNVSEWIQDQNENMYRAVRGGNYLSSGDIKPVAYCKSVYYNNSYVFVGFRATLCIK